MSSGGILIGSPLNKYCFYQISRLTNSYRVSIKNMYSLHLQAIYAFTYIYKQSYCYICVIIYYCYICDILVLVLHMLALVNDSWL